MGRLIDADAIKWDKCEDADGNPVYVLDKRDIDAQPTAFDPDRVVEQLKALTEEECTLHECGIRSEHCKACIAKKAIEIVKGGGVDLELECKWKLEEEGNLYVTECENRHLVFDGAPEENGYRYCPYCGRKIKEVE